MARGQTALYDAIGLAVETMDNIFLKHKKNTINFNYIILIMTDGMENGSKKYNRTKIKEIIKLKKELGWEIKFMGANQNAELSGKGMGFEENDCATFAPTPCGMLNLMRTISNTVERCRSGGSCSFTPEDKFSLSSDFVYRSPNQSKIRKKLNRPPAIKPKFRLKRL